VRPPGKAARQQCTDLCARDGDGPSHAALAEGESGIREAARPAQAARAVARRQATSHGIVIVAAHGACRAREHAPSRPGVGSTTYGSTAFHAASAASEVSAKRYRYTSKERDEETGFY
jgi:hypothetical protein